MRDNLQRVRELWPQIAYWGPALVYTGWQWLRFEEMGGLERVFYALFSGFMAQIFVLIAFLFAMYPARAPIDEIKNSPLVTAAMYMGIGLMIFRDFGKTNTENHVIACVEDYEYEHPETKLSEIVALCFESEHDDDGPEYDDY